MTELILTDNKYSHLGYFTDISDAIAAREHAEQMLGYHKNHGRLANAR